MYILLAVVIVVVTIDNRASALWVTRNDFNSSELVNLTLQKEHELMLEKLMTKSSEHLEMAFLYEIYAHAIGQSFFEFKKDKIAVRKNNAVIRAALECAKNLLTQDSIWSILATVSYNGARYVQKFKSFPIAISLVCGDLDYLLKDEVFYTNSRFEYNRKAYFPPHKIYHYGIPESEPVELKLMQRLLNEPKMKVIMGHYAWFRINESNNSTLRDIKNSILNLANESEEFEKVQEIYEQSINDVIPLTESLDMTFLTSLTSHSSGSHLEYLQSNLTQRIWDRIVDEIPDWKDYRECETTGGDNRRCGKNEVGQNSMFQTVWPVTSDFGPFELQNLTLQQEHEIFLQKLSSSENERVSFALFLELMAKSMGNDFFGLVEDEESNIMNNAIVRAATDCLSNLRLQNETLRAMFLIKEYSYLFLLPTSDISQGFTDWCWNINDFLKDETFYTTKRDAYLEQKLSVPKKTFQYNVGKPTDDQRKIITDFLNDSRNKKIIIRSLWMKLQNPDLKKFRYCILELVKVQSKSEAVNRIYEQAIEDVTKNMRNITFDEIIGFIFSYADYYDLDRAYLDVRYLTDQIAIGIKERPDLSALFEAIGKRYEMLAAEQTTVSVPDQTTRSALSILDEINEIGL